MSYTSVCKTYSLYNRAIFVMWNAQYEQTAKKSNKWQQKY